MIKAFFISSQEVSEGSRNLAIKHCRHLANSHGFFIKNMTIHSFHVTLVTDSSQDTIDKGDQVVELVLGKVADHPHVWDRFLIIRISATGLVMETDYAGSIPVYHSMRGGFTLSNIEPCVYLASESSLNDISFENLYGFLRYSHFIWDETAWKHIYQLLPDARYAFTPRGKISSEEYLATVKSSELRCRYTDKQAADELFELNRRLVLRSLADAENIILPLSSGYDSRMILAVLANDEALLQKTRCFTYGTPGAIDVESSKRLTKLKGVDWNYINIPCRFLTRRYLEDITDIFGASLHMHGMYQNEFVDEIKAKHGVLPGTRFTSGFMTGVPAGQHNGLLQVKDDNAKLTEAMNRFSQSKVWCDADLNRMPVFSNKNYLEIAEHRFRKAFDRFDGEIYQKAVMFDVWTRQRNFISYYPRVFEWIGSVASPHMCPEYANFFMSLNRKHLWNRKAMELMFLTHYPDIAGVASNSNGIKSLSGQLENLLLFTSRVLRKLGLPNPLPPIYHNVPIEFDLQAVRNCQKESVYPLAANHAELIDFMNNFGGDAFFQNLYNRAAHGDINGYEKLITFQAVALNGLLAARLGGLNV